jgi:2',3'-cyclic-nucleotide 2'-phosphodiesterase (5'-nucleotidase family)
METKRQPPDPQLIGAISEVHNANKRTVRKSIGRKHEYVYRSRTTRLQACPFAYS